MAIIAMDGFDISSNSNNNLLNQNFSNYVHTDHVNYGAGVIQGIFGDYADPVVGFHFYTLATPRPTSLIAAFHWRIENGESGNGELFSVVLSDGIIPVRIESHTHSFLSIKDKNNNRLATTTNPCIVKKDEFNWLSIKVVIDSVSGLVEVKDAYGDTILSYNGDTRQGSSSNEILRVFLGNNITNRPDFDNFVLATTSGGTINDHITEHRIITLRPNANGDTVTGWTANGASAVWDCLDETNIDNNSTNISTTTDGATFLVNFQDLATAETGYKAVSLTHWCVREDAGLWYITPKIKTGGIVYSGTEMKMPNANTAAYGPFTHIWELNPNTSSAWAATEINALQGGLTVRLAT
jgi:hypothetical protein